MTTPARLFQFLYVSDATSGVVAADATDIASTSRPRNLSAGISGALLFDGGRFCQLLEGLEHDIRVLMARIAVDSRHRLINELAVGHFGLPALTTRWRLALCARSALDPLATTPTPRDEVALALFMSALTVSSVV